MTHPRARAAVRRALVAAAVVLAVAASVLAWLSRDTPTPQYLSFGSKPLEIVFPLALLTFVAVGELIATRHPDHLVAWAFISLGLSGEIILAAQDYGFYAGIVSPGALPAGTVVLWVATWIWALPLSAFVVALLVFPDGRPLATRWWAVAGVSIVGGLAQAMADALRGAMTGMAPFSIDLRQDALDAISIVGTILWSFALLAAGASMVVRFRRARGEERQKIKWFAFASVIAVFFLFLSTFAYGSPEIAPFMSAVGGLAALTIPTAAGIAILRYRLYDIDVVIERTLVYGSLSAVIAGTYVVFVVSLQALLRPVTGGSEIAVAGSTLATLGLAQPLRRRIQRAVDRRFYRARYDAARTLDAFTTRLRDEVDLNAVRADLLSAIDETVRPKHANIWLR